MNCNLKKKFMNITRHLQTILICCLWHLLESGLLPLYLGSIKNPTENICGNYLTMKPDKNFQFADIWLWWKSYIYSANHTSLPTQPTPKNIFIYFWFFWRSSAIFSFWISIFSPFSYTSFFSLSFSCKYRKIVIVQ